MNMMVMVPEEEKVTTNYVQVDHETNAMFTYDHILKKLIYKDIQDVFLFINIKNFTIITYDPHC